MKCPSCINGVQEASFVDFADGSAAYNVPFKCERCDGTGEMPDERLEWIMAGNALRQMRKEQGLTLLEAAKRTGLTMVQFSRMERGIEKPYTLEES